MYYSVDRIESGIAVCESDERKKMDIPLTELPADVREGDILLFDGTRYSIDQEETAKRRNEAAQLQKKLFGGHE